MGGIGAPVDQDAIDIRRWENRTFARFPQCTRWDTIGRMDAVGMVVIALSAFALLEVAAMNLRGEDRHARSRRTRRSQR